MTSWKEQWGNLNLFPVAKSLVIFITSLSTLLKPVQHKTVLTTKCSENLFLSLLAILFYFSSVLLHFPDNIFLFHGQMSCLLDVYPGDHLSDKTLGTSAFSSLSRKLLLISLIPCTRFTRQEEFVVLMRRECSHVKERGDGVYHFCSCLLPPPPHGTTHVKEDLNRNHKWPPT